MARIDQAPPPQPAALAVQGPRVLTRFSGHVTASPTACGLTPVTATFKVVGRPALAPNAEVIARVSCPGVNRLDRATVQGDVITVSETVNVQPNTSWKFSIEDVDGSPLAHDATATYRTMAG